ncbi:N-acetylneuraminate lyase-like [Leguminivora glycinivorella]|uniref:N-acetylneuraminate lyase-like n=1 Tax=Leguminivora glycinivorella TaxID=1035111 RepID=UPI00200FA9C3|nr:N-acetylneuraminate lyase-like [Leguminivora glycinivorella]
MAVARGLMMAVFTSLKEDFTVNFDAINAYAQYVLKSGYKSVLVGGTTGEHMTLNLADRKKSIDLWLAAMKPAGIHVMVQVGGAPIPDVQELAKYCQSIGVDSLLTMPELYFKPKNADELVNYVGLVAKAAPKLPIFYYHNPGRSNVQINAPEFMVKATARIPNFKGMKYSPSDMSEAAQVLRVLKEGQEVYVSDDTQLAPAALLGVKSFMCTSFSLFPKLAQDIIAAVEAKDIDKARALQETLSLAIEAHLTEGEWVPSLKAGMEIVTDIKVGPPSPVLQPISVEAKKRIEAKLKALKLVK